MEFEVGTQVFTREIVQRICAQIRRLRAVSIVHSFHFGLAHKIAGGQLQRDAGPYAKRAEIEAWRLDIEDRAGGIDGNRH